MPVLFFFFSTRYGNGVPQKKRPVQGQEEGEFERNGRPGKVWDKVRAAESKRMASKAGRREGGKAR